MIDLKQGLSDRVTALEQLVLGLPSNEEDLRQLLNENRELASVLKSRLSEISELQSSIEEKIVANAPAASLGEKIDSLGSRIDGLADLVVDTGTKINRVDRARHASIKRINRRFKSFEEKLEDFKKVRKAIRKQGKRITVLQDETVEKTSFQTALGRIRASKAKKKSRKRKAAKGKVVGVSAGKPLVLKAKEVKIVGATAKVEKKAKAKVKTKAKPHKKQAVRKRKAGKTRTKAPAKAQSRQRISISAPASTKVEITPKK